MSGNNQFLLDTNIVLYLLNAYAVIADIISTKTPYLYFITEMELLSYSKLTIVYESKIKLFLSDCTIIEMNHAIKLAAIKIRKTYKLKLPDSIIAATGSFLDIPLLTADIEFNKLKSLQILQYKKQ